MAKEIELPDGTKIIGKKETYFGMKLLLKNPKFKEFATDNGVPTDQIQAVFSRHLIMALNDSEMGPALRAYQNEVLDQIEAGETAGSGWSTL